LKLPECTATEINLFSKFAISNSELPTYFLSQTKNTATKISLTNSKIKNNTRFRKNHSHRKLKSFSNLGCKAVDFTLKFQHPLFITIFKYSKIIERSGIFIIAFIKSKTTTKSDPD
jgi:hypothetical protein